MKDSFHFGFENGMFAVNKDADRDRLVLDSRASNLLDLGQSVWSRAMAAASSVALLYLDDDAVLLSSGETERTSRTIFISSRSAKKEPLATSSKAAYPSTSTSRSLDVLLLLVTGPSMLVSPHLPWETFVQLSMDSAVMLRYV